MDEEERAGKAAAADLSHQAEKKQQLRCLLTARYQTLLLQADKYATELEALRQELSGMSDGEEEYGEREFFRRRCYGGASVPRDLRCQSDKRLKTEECVNATSQRLQRLLLSDA